MTLLDEILNPEVTINRHRAGCNCRSCRTKHSRTCNCKSCQNHRPPFRHRKTWPRRYNNKAAAILKKALSKGIRSENKLTDILFYLRHPEMPWGYKIKRHQMRLAKEWLYLRNRYVRPLLSKLSRIRMQ